MKSCTIILLVFLFSLAAGQASAAIPSFVGKKWDEDKYQLQKLLAATGTDKDVRAAYKKILLARMSHEESILKERGKVLYWTNRVGVVIFVLTHLILFIGIWAAIKEFLSASKIRNSETEQSEIKVSMEGIALKTSLHGTLLFALTLFLYFLFLKFVYPINVI